MVLVIMFNVAFPGWLEVHKQLKAAYTPLFRQIVYTGFHRQVFYHAVCTTVCSALHVLICNEYLPPLSQAACMGHQHYLSVRGVGCTTGLATSAVRL